MCSKFKATWFSLVIVESSKIDLRAKVIQVQFMRFTWQNVSDEKTTRGKEKNNPPNTGNCIEIISLSYTNTLLELYYGTFPK